MTEVLAPVPVTDVTDHTDHNVYRPQHDSRLLADVLASTGLARGGRVADLCTGSGVLAIAAARLGAASVMGFDLSPSAVTAARENAAAAGYDVDVRQASFAEAVAHGPFDVVTCNPPYVPEPDADSTTPVPLHAGPPMSYNAGSDGRLVLEPLCAVAADLLSEDGTMLIVHSELAGVDASLTALRGAGLKAAVIARQWIPFGPVLTARAEWLEETGRITLGRRIEQLVVIRADVP